MDVLEGFKNVWALLTFVLDFKVTIIYATGGTISFH